MVQVSTAGRNGSQRTRAGITHVHGHRRFQGSPVPATGIRSGYWIFLSAPPRGSLQLCPGMSARLISMAPSDPRPSAGRLWACAERGCRSSSSGPVAMGGQNGSKVSTCVMLRHRPSSVPVKGQDRRQQGLNLQTARGLLLDRLATTRRNVWPPNGPWSRKCGGRSKPRWIRSESPSSPPGSCVRPARIPSDSSSLGENIPDKPRPT